MIDRAVDAYEHTRDYTKEVCEKLQGDYKKCARGTLTVILTLKELTNSKVALNLEDFQFYRLG